MVGLVTNRVCLMGVFDVVMHVPPLLLFYWFAFLLLYLTYVPDTGYQWAPLHVV